ncbi:MAG TPA: penicillin-binding protein activator [Steroidobacteraceae bacterium]|nr:penicillin-binding protein activator [Steroidobacteraceae bacterium]
MRVSLGRWLVLGVAAAVTACVSLPPPVAPSVATGQQAAELAHRGQHTAAAAAYEALAALRAAPERIDLQLLAAREWLAGGRTGEAARVLAQLAGPQSAAQAYEHALLDAEVSLDAHRTEQAWRQINAISPGAAPAAALRYFSLRMRIALAAGRAIDAIRSEMAGERDTRSGAELSGLRAELLARLLEARARGMRLLPQTSTDPTVRGWLELGAMAPLSHAASLANVALAARWRALYPNHPALAILGQAFPSPPISTAPGSRIALLLPLTGPQAAAGATVRDGFLSALYQLPPAGRPDLHVYDTATMPAVEALAQARAGGSTFVVGPLTHEAVSAVAALGPEPVPVLALNFLPDGQVPPRGLYQYALSPEEGARQVARRILADGLHRGIAVVPRNEWGNSVAAAFASELAAGGGSVIAQAGYDPAGHDYGDQLRSVLGIDESQARHQHLERALRTKLNFEPRHRGDIEFVFVATPAAVNARLIEPQLRYFYAGDIPSYSIWNAYEPDSLDANRDIAGLMYPDMPWMISGDSSMDELRTSIGQIWNTRAAWRSRLFAFGYDACQLMLAMSSPQSDPGYVQIAGLTGLLHFDANRRVLRDLIWVRIDRNGDPRPLPAPGAASSSASGQGEAGSQAVPVPGTAAVPAPSGR